MHRVFVLHSSFWLSYHAHHIFKRLILQPTPFHSTTVAAATTENVLEIHRNDQHVYSDCWCYCRCLAPWKTQNSYKFYLVGRIVWILTKFSWLNAKFMLGWRETLILVLYSRWISANYTVSTLFKRIAMQFEFSLLLSWWTNLPRIRLWGVKTSLSACYKRSYQCNDIVACLQQCCWFYANKELHFPDLFEERAIEIV